MKENPDHNIFNSIEKSYKTFFENCLDAIMITSQDGSIHAANQAACKMFGWTEEELVRLGRGGIVEMNPSLIEALNERRKTGKFFGELTYIKKDGTRFPVEISSSVYKHYDGREFTTIISRDISKRKKFEKALGESEERLRLATNAGGFGTYSYEFECGKAFYSDEFLAFYGLLPGERLELDSDLIAKALVPDDKPRFLAAMSLAIDPKGSGILDIEFRIIHRNGEIRWLKTRGLTVFTGKGRNRKPLHANGVVQDITARKRTEMALNQSLDWQRAIFEGSLDAIFISDEDSFLVAVNNAACDLTGYSKEELLKMRIPDLHDKHDLEAYRKYHKKIFNGEKILSEAKIRRRDGVKVDTEFNNSRISISGKLYMHTTARDISERKKSERELFEFGERYRLLTENSGLGIGYYTTDGKIIMFNQQAINDIGGKAEDYIGKNLTEVFGKEIGQLYLNRIKLAAVSEKPLKFEDNVNLNGRPGWYMSTHTRILDLNGKVDGIQVVADNITERKKNEEIIKTSEAEYRSLFENSIIGISQAYGGGKTLKVNKAYLELYGYPDSETFLNEVGSNTSMLFSNPEDRIRVLSILNKSDFMAPTEFELNKRNGEKIWALVGAKQVRDTSGKILFLQAEHIDITNQKKMEKERYLASLYARNLIEASLDPLVTINSEGKITDVNFATEKVTGFKRNKLIGSDFADYFIENEKAREGYNLVFSRGEVKNYPLTLRHRNGRTTDVLYNATVFKNENGVVQGVFAAARDITVRKKMEVKLRDSKRLLEKLNHHLNDIRENERSEIALNLHDDLGQRLTALSLDVAWIRNRIGVQASAVTKKLEEMMHEINDTIDGIKELSAFLRPTILYDLGLVPAIISQLRKFEKQTGINCDFYFDSEEFNGDEKISLILYRVIQESLTNIVRHSRASAMEVNLKKLRNAIELVVIDNGIGIDNDKINSISSLGLEGIRERVKSAHGEVSIKSEKGSGTTIRVKIPLKKN